MIDVPVKLGPRSYRVAVGAGLLAQVGPEISRLGVGRKLALLTDPAIKALYGEI
ncbi:MAG: 3-dehydroquinate synthase, partial [Candidatus Rokuibacteriota bacterium]